MKEFKIFKFSEMWSINSLLRFTEKKLQELSLDGWEIVTVSFGINLWMMPTSYITAKRVTDK